MNNNLFDKYIEPINFIYGKYDQPMMDASVSGGSSNCQVVSNRIITICGAMKFADEMKKQEIELTKQGYIVLMPVMNIGETPLTEDELKIYRKAHKRKIDMADSILVINKDGYVGRHTASEIEAASKLKKYIYFLENANKELK